MPFNEHKEFEMNDCAGPERDKHDIITNTVVFNDGRKFTKFSGFEWIPRIHARHALIPGSSRTTDRF